MVVKTLFTENIFPLLDAIVIPVIICDESGNVVRLNKTADDFFRKKASHITGLLPYVVIEDNETLLSLSEGKSDYILDTDADAGGKTVKVDVTISVIKSNGQRLYVCTVKDISVYSALMDSIGKFNSIMENSPASVLITDMDGNIEFFNKKFQDLTGYGFQELMGRNVSMLRSDFDKKEYKTKIRESLGPGDSWKGELVNTTRNGDQCWLLASIAPLVNKNGAITGYFSIQEDITYLKKIENELKQSQEKLRILFESFPEGIIVTDLSGMILQVNHAYLNIYGYNGREQIEGRNIYDVSDKTTVPILGRLLEDAGNRGCSETVSYETPGDVTAYIELQAVLMTDENAASLGFIILAADNTARKKAETALRESEARNRALIEAIPDIMFRVNNQGVYLDKMLGKKIIEVFPESIAKDTVKYISEAIKTREIQIFEYPVTVSGREEFYESRFIAIEDDEVLIILRNVTERHTAMMQIEESRRDAELANRSKSEFLANMSHEIRTPLNSITGFIELLLRSRPAEYQREYLEIIKKSAVSLLEIINDILDFSKIESHKLELNKISFNPFVEFESVVRLFNVKAGEKGMKFISFIDPRIPENVISDPLRIKQILSNLLSNAIKFTPEDGLVMIEISLSRNKDGFCLINFAVSDTGIGIPERKQKQIFEAFAQADSSITRRYGGTGLGLSISSSLARLLGSEVVLESEMGVGSRFYFTVEAEVRTDLCPADTVRNSGISASIVAIRADDPSVRNLETYLRACNCDVKISAGIFSAFDDSCDIIFAVNPSAREQDLAEYAMKGQGKPLILVVDNNEKNDRYSPEMKRNFHVILNHPLTPEMIINALTLVAGRTEQTGDVADKTGMQRSIAFSGKVLVGEDNSINQKLMMLLLKDYGIEVELAGNGLAVFEKFLKSKYDLIFMDINMPVADGLETSRMIREYENENRIPPTPIIALTAKALKGDMESIMQSGMDDYLSKPLEMDKLELILRKYLECVKCSESPEQPADQANETGSVYYDLKKSAAEIRIPVNVLVNIGRDFFEDTAETLAVIDSAIDSCSWRDISSFSHKLKGAAANLRFTRLSEFFAILEEKSCIPEKGFDYKGILDNINNEIKTLKNFF